MLVIDIKVIPSSGKLLCKLNKEGQLVCYLKSAPERNMANIELVRYLAKMLDISQQDVSIVGGLTSRKKRIRINTAITRQELLKALSIEEQMSFVKKDMV